MKLLCIFALLLAGPMAFASKARVSSLQGANHLIDTQTVFTSPSHIHLLDPYLTFEMGAAGTDAEGGFMRELSSGKRILVYLGHQNTTASDAQGDIRSERSYLTQNNPLEVIYGTGNMAFGASLSNVNNDASNTKETTLVGKFGMNYGDKGWSYAHLTLISTAEKRTGANTSNDELSISPYLTVGGSFVIAEAQRVYGELDYGSAEETYAAGGPKLTADDMNLHVGYEHQFVQTEDADIYYGLEYRMDKRAVEQGANKGDAESTSLPAYIGIEYKANSWATVRASVKQNILIGEKKDETATLTSSKSDGIDADTMVSAGLGLKYNNIVLDGALTAATSGQVNGTQFLQQASLTYTF